MYLVAALLTLAYKTTRLHEGHSYGKSRYAEAAAAKITERRMLSIEYLT